MCLPAAPRGPLFPSEVSEKTQKFSFAELGANDSNFRSLASLPVAESLGKLGVREPDTWQHNEAQCYQEQER
jgi:hypothetical protein